MCDAILASNDGAKFPVHRVLLSTVPYFDQLLLPHASVCGSVDVSCDHLTEAVLQCVLDYVYTGECRLSADTVPELLTAAVQMYMSQLVDYCWRYVDTQLTPDNCITFARLARKLNCNGVAKSLQRYGLLHFAEVEWTVPFMEMDAAELAAFLSDSVLNVKREQYVFSAIVRWVRYNYSKRKAALPSMLDCVRFGLTNPAFITDVMSHPLVLDCPEAESFMSGPRLIVEEAASALTTNYDHTQMLTCPREPPEILFSIGGWSGGSPINSIETYDARTNCWFMSVHTDTRPRAYHSLEVVDNKIYMLGGFDGTGHFNSVRRYDPYTRQWSERACMYTRRCYVSTCVLYGQIYAIGGSDGRQRLRTCERYDPVTNQWQQLADMHASRSDAAAAAVNGRVYVAGGFNGLHVLDSVEVYDPSENVWTFAYAMNSPRSGVSLLQWRDTLYALGGFDGERRLQTCERLPLYGSEQWLPIASMASARSNFACAVLEDGLVVMGGFNGQTTIAAVERYDPRRDRWTPLAEMHIHRSALSACVVQHLANGRHYSYLGHYDPQPDQEEPNQYRSSEPGVLDTGDQ